MPEPLLYFQAMAATAAISLFLVLIANRLRPLASDAWMQGAVVLALCLGHLAGYYFLRLHPSWPPSSALDRLMVVVLPAVVVLEGLACLPRAPGKLIWLIRLTIAMTAGRILLHGSVYLSGLHREWTEWQAAGVLVGGTGLLIAVWVILTKLFQRSAGITIPLALVLAIQSAGICVMLAGYIEGGAAALPVTASLLGVVIAIGLLKQASAAQAAIGIGVVQLFGLLWIGRFFGGLTTGAALAMLLAPLLCLVSELRIVRRQKPWIVGAIRLTLVAIPLIIVLWLAKQKFDRELAPLLGHQIQVETDTERCAPVNFMAMMRHELRVMPSGRRG